MKKILFYVLIFCCLGLFNLHAKSMDKIEMLVNELLLEQEMAKVNFEGNYFIQMSAYSLHKPDNLIDKIRQKGYDIVIKKAQRGGKMVNLVLVGPFKKESRARENLSALRLIEKGAFIYKDK